MSGAAAARQDALPPWVAWLLRTSGGALALLPFLPPIFARVGQPALASAFDAIWASACHRMPERSLSFLGTVMPLCSRCLGLVVGLGAGLVIGRPFYGLHALRLILTVACALLFAELTTQDLGWHSVFHPTRLLSGLLVAFPVGAAATALATGAPLEPRGRRREVTIPRIAG